MLKYIYFGTPELSRDLLDNLIKIYSKPELIITALDRPSGRGLKMKPCPVKEYTIENNIPYLEPDKLINIKEDLKSYNADIGILFAYGKIIPQWLLEIFPNGIINVHPSLLPLYRGSSPLIGPILNEDTTTGITIMDMDSELDHGDIYLQNKIEIKPDTNRNDLENYVINTAPQMLKEVLEKIEEKNINKISQDHNLATYTTKIKKSDGEILNSDTDEIKYRKYKAYIGWPGIYYINPLPASPLSGGGENHKIRIKITKASFIDNKFIIEKIIPEGGKEKNYNKKLN